MSVSPASAQENDPLPLLVGPVIATGAGFEATTIPVFGGYSECGAFNSGSSLDLYAGGSLFLPSLFSSNIGFTLDLLAGHVAGALTTTPIEPQRLFEVETGSLVELDETYERGFSWWTVMLRPMVTLSLSDGWSLLGGPGLGYRFGQQFTATDRIDGPGDYRFADGSREQPLAGATPLTPSALEVGLSAGIAHAMAIYDNDLLQLRLLIEYTASSPVERFSWSSIGASLGAAWYFGSSPADDQMFLPPPAPLPAASIQVIGLDAEGNRLPVPEVMVETRTYRRHAPLLPAVFFDRDEDGMAERYTLVDAPRQQFGDRRIADRSLVQLQHELPAIIGRRMQQYPAARLSIYGSVSGDESSALAAVRAENVRRSLSRSFGIEPERLYAAAGNPVLKRSSEVTEPGREDNRRVEFSSDDSRVLAPIVIERTERLFDPPSIIVEPRIQAESGVDRWEVVVMQGGEIVARFGREGEAPANVEPEFTWRIVDDLIDSSLAPIVAILHVIDRRGNEVSDTVITPLRVRRKSGAVNADIERNGERERLTWTLIGFDFNQATPRVEEYATIDAIASMVRDGAELHITGTTDVIGSETVNSELALQRARSTAQLLKERLDREGRTDVRISVAGVGEERVRFGEEWPEARLLSRGVEIVIEQGRK